MTKQTMTTHTKGAAVTAATAPNGTPARPWRVPGDRPLEVLLKTAESVYTAGFVPPREMIEAIRSTWAAMALDAICGGVELPPQLPRWADPVGQLARNAASGCRAAYAAGTPRGLIAMCIQGHVPLVWREWSGGARGPMGPGPFVDGGLSGPTVWREALNSCPAIGRAYLDWEEKP